MAKATRAFTLVETMFAAAVFGIGLVGVIAILSKTAQFSAQSAHLAAATQCATNKVERLSSLSSQALSNLGTAGSVSYFDHFGLQAAHPSYAGPFFTCVSRLQPSTHSQLNWTDITVTCSWPEGILQTNHSISLAARAVMP